MPASASDLPAIGLTMFGVTTPLVTQLVDALKTEYDPLVFHATGTGGQSMEKLVDSGMVTAVLDMTTTEVADYLVGGVFPAGPDRFGAIARTRVPYVGSCGALDMVNFGSARVGTSRVRRSPAPCAQPAGDVDAHDGRREQAVRHVHRLEVERVRGTRSFLAAGRWCLAARRVGQAFFDPEADEALFATIEAEVNQTKNRQVVRVPHPINHPKFGAAALAAFHEITGRAS